MRKMYKLFGIVLLASAMTIWACDKDKTEDTNTPAGNNEEQGGQQGGDTNSTVTYTIVVETNDAAKGTVSGGGTYRSGESVVLTATANDGFVFSAWQDGVTDNPRTIVVTGDATYTATFVDRPAAQCVVTVDGTDWTPAYVSGAIARNGFNVWLGKTDATHMPLCNIYCVWDSTTSALGNHHGAPAFTPVAGSDGQYNISFGNPRVWYFNRGQVNFSNGQGGMSYTGDWWGKSVDVNITNFDPQSGLATMEVTATLAYVKDSVFTIDSTNAVISLHKTTFEEAPTATFRATLSNVSLTPQTSKVSTKPQKAVVRRP